MKKLLLSTTLICMMVLNLWGGLGVKPVTAATMVFGEARITSNSADQLNPDMYQYGLNHYAVVWQDNRKGNWDIYMYFQKSLGDGLWDVRYDVQITSNSGNNENPRIFDDVIVYQSDRNGNWDIYMYNLTSKVETQITTNTADQVSCAVYDEIIVWQDWRNMLFTNPYNDMWKYPGMEIYMYNLTSQIEEVLPLPHQACFSPSISGDLVVYVGEDYWVSTYWISYYDPYVCAYNISTGEGYTVASVNSALMPKWASSPRCMSSPAVDGVVAAWTENDRNSGVWKFSVKNVSSGVLWTSGSVGGPYYPDVSGDFVVYQGFIDGGWDLYLYDLSSESVFVASDAVANQVNPKISVTEYGSSIVYQDNRNGNWDIYSIGFWYGGMMGGGSSPAKPITPSRVISNLQETKSKIVNTPMSGFAGANNKVKENRKNLMINKFDSAIANIEAAVNTQNLKVRKTYLQRTINQLKSMIDKVDGWTLREAADIPGSGFTPDWITAPIFLDQLIRSCQNDLQTLLNGIT